MHPKSKQTLTKEQQRIIRRHYEDMSQIELAVLAGTSARNVFRFMAEKNLVRPGKTKRPPPEVKKRGFYSSLKYNDFIIGI